MPFLWRSDRDRSFAPERSPIPRNLHFLWGFLGDNGPLAAREQHNFDLWRGMNPDWQMTVQSPETLSAVVNNHPRQELYEAFPTAIQRCDLARPMLLEKYGGVYSDLDVRPYRDLDWLCGLFPHARVLLVEEVTLSRGSSVRRGNRFAIRNGRPELRLRVANFWMASVAGHPFWRDVMDLVEERSHLAVRHDYDVIYTTGPDVISEVYDRTHQKYRDVALVPRATARRFFRHRTHGSWRVQKTGKRWAA
jgi:mannosyltransferase OCH1-like enzyme